MTTTWSPSTNGVLAALRSRITAQKLAAEPIAIDNTAASIAEPQKVQPALPWSASFNARFGPMMPLQMVSYVQLGFFDNGARPLEYVDGTGKTRKRHKGLRYKASIEAWCAPAHLIQKRGGAQFDRQVQLRAANSFETKIIDVNAESGKFGPAFVRELRDAVIAHPDDLFGVISDRNNGFNYFERQFVRVSWMAGLDGTKMPSITLRIDGETLTADAMTDKFLTERQKAAGLLCQQFVDRCNHAKHVAAQKSAQIAKGGSRS